jgi:hypothetical protein
MPDVTQRRTQPSSGFVAVAVSALGLSSALGVSSTVEAQDQGLASLPAMHAACHAADDDGVHDRLYSVVLDAPTTLEPRDGDEDGQVLYTIPDARSLRAFGGSVQIVPSHLETVAFVANEERARTLEVARSRGARIRLGFFLGFDEPERRACLVRASQAVTAVRADIAFVELLDAEGAVIAREDHDRLRAWSDDPDRTAAREPEVTIGAPTTSGGPPTEAWIRAVRAPAISRQLLACHVAGVARGASREAMLVVRLRVDARAGRVEDAVVEVGNVGDEAENVCLVAALRGVELGTSTATGSVDLRVPVRLRVP